MTSKRDPPQESGVVGRIPISNQSSLLLIPYNLYTYYTYVLHGYRPSQNGPSCTLKSGRGWIYELSMQLFIQLCMQLFICSFNF